MNMEDFKKNKLDFNSMKRVLSYFSLKQKILLIFVLLCILITAAVSAGSALFIQVLIDDYIQPLLLESSPVFTELIHLLVVMGVIFAIGILSSFVYTQIMIGIAHDVLKRIRDDMFIHMQTLPIRYFDTHSHGDIMSRFTNDTDTLRQMITQSIPSMVSSAFTIIAIIAAMIYSNWMLTILVIVGAIVMTITMGKIAGNSAKYFVKQQESIGDVNGYIEEMINGQKVVKVFCYEDRAKEAFDKKNDELCKNATAAHTFANILMPIMGNLGNLLYVLVAFVGGILMISGFGTVTSGIIISFLQLTKSFTNPISQVSQQMNSIIMAMAGASRIFELIDEKPEEDNGYVTLVRARNVDNQLVEVDEHTPTHKDLSLVWAWKHPHQDGTTTYTEVRGDVRFFDVDFSYDGEKQVLYDVSLFAKPGQKIAFVGATGAGKTTITNLINRFYDIADGKIRYDDININKIKKSDLRRSLGIVLQETNLFTGSVIDNIRYGRLDATDEECIAAAKLANADGYISLLPDGYNTILTTNGSSLSQGQCQLLSIARAAVADPPVMILDEATSSIDTRTEAIIQRGMDALMENRTVFVIAHRLSTVQNAKAILVLENGHVIERGDHESLVAEKGKYYMLYTGGLELD
ncbi:MAG TPA: ABC transporter ATP-binding protein [Bacillota bacterium]|nr:ABC transporter ATP-binding protein [Bacillota bacterium]HPE39133.1 ABC transporter ATP-binding protein [Bacillota bacterium]